MFEITLQPCDKKSIFCINRKTNVFLGGSVIRKSPIMEAKHVQSTSTVDNATFKQISYKSYCFIILSFSSVMINNLNEGSGCYL